MESLQNVPEKKQPYFKIAAIMTILIIFFNIVSLICTLIYYKKTGLASDFSQLLRIGSTNALSTLTSIIFYAIIIIGLFSEKFKLVYIGYFVSAGLSFVGMIIYIVSMLRLHNNLYLLQGVPSQFIGITTPLMLAFMIMGFEKRLTKYEPQEPKVKPMPAAQPMYQPPAPVQQMPVQTPPAPQSVQQPVPQQVPQAPAPQPTFQPPINE